MPRFESSLKRTNPFKKQKIRRAISFKRIALPALLMAWLSLVIYLPYFRITKITYSGLKIIKQTELGDMINQNFLERKKIWPANNYFLLNSGAIAAYLQNTFSLNAVQVKKIFPHTLQVELQEKISTVIYDNGHKYFLLDQNGTAIKYLRAVGEKEFVLKQNTAPRLVAGFKTTATSTAAISTVEITTTTNSLTHLPDYGALKKEFGDYPIIYDLVGPTTTAEKQTGVLKPEMIKGIIDIYNNISRGGVALVNYFTIDNPGTGVTVYTNQPWKVFIQPLEDIEAQLNNLKIVLNSNYSSEYVDVRFGERVYWK